jgi:superoxide dismutase, Cu-Zn family
MRLFHKAFLSLAGPGFFFLCLADAAHAESGVAYVQPAAESSKTSGKVYFDDTASGLRVRAEISNLSPSGRHGFHIHEFGACGNAGADAGGHFNPAGVSHGLMTRDGMANAHPGDMGNLESDTDGNARLEVTLNGVTLAGGVPSVAGRAVIVHENQDDFSQPTGNAGGRIGCGQIQVIKPAA